MSDRDSVLQGNKSRHSALKLNWFRPVPLPKEPAFALEPTFFPLPFATETRGQEWGAEVGRECAPPFCLLVLPGLALVPAAEAGSTSPIHAGAYRASHSGVPPGARQGCLLRGLSCSGLSSELLRHQSIRSDRQHPVLQASIHAPGRAAEVGPYTLCRPLI